MEHIALFEERVSLTPRDLRQKITDIEGFLLNKLASRLENKCTRHGFLLPGTLKVLSCSKGYVEKGRFTGDIVFHMQTEGKVLNPPAGIIVEGDVIRKNKMGMYISFKDAIRIILPRDLHIGDEVFEGVLVGQKVRAEIQKSRFQVNDPYILSVGLFRGVVGEGGLPPIPSGEEKGEQTEEVKVEEETKVEEEKKVNEGPTVEEEKKVEETKEEAEQEEEENIIIKPNMMGGNGPIRFYSKIPEFKELSNMYASPFEMDGKTWPSVEHYFQAQKFPTDPAYQEEIRKAKSGLKAKSLGQSQEHPIRPDWNTYRLEAMEKAVKAKFTQNEALKKLLLSTGTRELQEASPTDSYWGVGKSGKGENHLGKILMKLRNSLTA